MRCVIRKGGKENLYLHRITKNDDGVVGGYYWTPLKLFATRFHSQNAADKYAAKVGLTDYGTF